MLNIESVAEPGANPHHSRSRRQPMRQCRPLCRPVNLASTAVSPDIAEPWPASVVRAAGRGTDPPYCCSSRSNNAGFVPDSILRGASTRAAAASGSRRFSGASRRVRKFPRDALHFQLRRARGTLINRKRERVFVGQVTELPLSLPARPRVAKQGG